MMMMPAARSKSRLSGILTMEFAGSAIFSRAPLWPDDATTRSPAFRPATPEPTLSTTPATSAAGENGNGGLIWYLPWIINKSKKFSAADLIAITASPGPATGSGTSASTRSSGWQYCEQRMAFMDTPDFRTHKEGWTLLAGFDAGLQSDSDTCPLWCGTPSRPQSKGCGLKGFKRCLKKACWRESAYWSPAAVPGLALRWDAASSSSVPNWSSAAAGSN